MSNITDKQRKELEELNALSEEAIDTQDIPEQLDWNNSIIGKFYRPKKIPITIRLDEDIVAFFKQGEGKYQTKINNALRKYIQSSDIHKAGDTA